MVAAVLACMMSERAGAGWVLLKDDDKEKSRREQRDAEKTERERTAEKKVGLFDEEGRVRVGSGDKARIERRSLRGQSNEDIIADVASDVLRDTGDRALVNYLEGITDTEIRQHVLDSNPKIAEIWETHTYRLGQNEGEKGVKEKLKEEGHDVTTGDEPVVHDPMDIGAQGHDEPEEEKASQRVAVR